MSVLFLNAIASGRLTQAKLLHKHGVNINSCNRLGHPAIFIALRLQKDKPRSSLVSWLLHIGADTGYVDPLTGRNLLTAAAYLNHTAEMQLLLNHGSQDMTARDNKGRTALHYAVLHNNGPAAVFIVDYATKYRINVDVADYKGWTPSLIATSLGMTEIRRLLPNVLNNNSASKSRLPGMHKEPRIRVHVEQKAERKSGKGSKQADVNVHQQSSTHLKVQHSISTESKSLSTSAEHDDITPSQIQRPATSLSRKPPSPNDSRLQRSLTSVPVDNYIKSPIFQMPITSVPMGQDTVIDGPFLSPKHDLAPPTPQLKRHLTALPRIHATSLKRCPTSASYVTHCLALQSQEQSGSFRGKVPKSVKCLKNPVQQTRSRGRKGVPPKRISFGTVVKITSIASNFRKKKKVQIMPVSDAQPSISRSSSKHSLNSEDARSRPRSGRSTKSQH